MTILNELLQMVSKSELDEQVKQICDEIMKEERPKFLNPFDEPIGPNIFLSVQFPDKKYISFLCLERESKEKYIVSKWSKPSNGTVLKRQKVWEVEDIGKAEKILKFYAETLKYVRGE
jgi:hypothetical protein